MNGLSNAALSYHQAGLCVLPALVAEKRPAVSSWKRYQERRPTEQEVTAWFSNAQEALCLVCGSVANNQEMIDFDLGGALYEAWSANVLEQALGLLEKLFVESTPSGGRHVSYLVEMPVCGNLKLAQRRIVCADGKPITIEGKTYKPRKESDGSFSVIVTLIETRGEGGLFLCAPSPGYAVIQSDLARLPVLTESEREILLEAAWSLNEYVPEPVSAVRETRVAPDDVGLRPGDDFNVRGDIRALLQKHGWAIAKPGDNEYWRRPGKEHGWSATLKGRIFYVFSSSAAPFEPNQSYSPFALYAHLEHGGDFAHAAISLRNEGFGDNPTANNDVDLSHFVVSEDKSDPPGPPDPGPIPEALLRVPGFIAEVMDHCLETAPYPNLVMSFCGAMALQAFLAGRKVRDPSDNRTNLYLLGLAHSAAGKDWPRKINTRIMHHVGLADCLGERFASGEGIQDALFVKPTMLFQTDEIDGILQQINKAQDARHENIMTTLLTMYSAANSIFPMRRKAGKESPGVIDQPCLVIFGTAIPNHYYEALSERMLTNGFFARMVILESGPRPQGQEAKILDLPPRILAVAKWWAEFAPGTGNLEHWHPVPAIVQYTDEAKRLLIETRQEADAEYTRAQEKSDAVGTTVWGRVNEQVRKLALIHAVSENHESPQITMAAAQWATRFVMHQTRRMLYMAQGHVAENPFHAACLRFLQKLRDAPGRRLSHRVLLKRMKMDAKAFKELVDTLKERGDIVAVPYQTAGRSGIAYQLVEENQVNEVGEG